MSFYFKKLFPSSLVHKDDEEIMKLLQGGDMAAFEVLYDRYRIPLYSYLRNQWDQQTAEDMLQEVFSKIINGKDGFAYKSSVRTWIWTICRNTTIDHIRSATFQHEKNRTDLTDEYGEEHFSSEVDSQEEVILAQTNRKQLEECLQELPENQREAVLLQIQSELSYEETASILKISVGALKSVLHRVKDKLIDCFKRGGHLD